jgi:hypothetical protein
MCKILSFGLDGAPELRRTPSGVEVSPTGIQSHQRIEFLHIPFHDLELFVPINLIAVVLMC